MARRNGGSDAPAKRTHGPTAKIKSNAKDADKQRRRNKTVAKYRAKKRKQKEEKKRQEEKKREEEDKKERERKEKENRK